ncbi:MAG: hypothetical protein ACJAUH_001935 [Saprospiraceae bacterium]|jgi:hypothetical protein|tara:strand:+ start:694 stop:927 length:234 start_codon:yes stop_codon:yes gene_type:complete
MEKQMVIQGKDIENLITKFYYKKRQLCFQIIINLGLSGSVSYSEYDDYFIYKQKFNELLDAKNQDKNILIPSIALQN